MQVERSRDHADRRVIPCVVSWGSAIPFEIPLEQQKVSVSFLPIVAASLFHLASILAP
jgi:hypothetical protein